MGYKSMPSKGELGKFPSNPIIHGLSCLYQLNSCCNLLESEQLWSLAASSHQQSRNSQAAQKTREA